MSIQWFFCFTVLVCCTNGKSLDKKDSNSIDLSGSFVYMTFDDGPNEGTPYVLDALKAAGVRATFFINSDNLLENNPTVAARNKESLIRMVREGHVIGDHSYDHMIHNTIVDTPRNAYVGLDSDITWFGQKKYRSSYNDIKSGRCAWS